MLFLKKSINNFRAIINLFLLFILKNIKIKSARLLSKIKIRSYKELIIIIINIERLDIFGIFKKMMEENPPQLIFNKN